MMTEEREDKPEHTHVETVPVEDKPEKAELKTSHVPATAEVPAVHAEVVRIGWRSWLIMFLTSFAIAAQVYVTGAITPNIIFITRDLGDPALVGWVVQAPVLMQSILSPSVGRLSDVLDRKWTVTIPPVFALVGSIVSARATSMTTLIGGGILIGITLPTAAIIHAIQAEILPMKYRALASGCSFVGAAIGGFAGSLGGGALTNLGPSGWRYAFWFEAALHGITALGFGLFYWPVRRSDYPKMTWKQLIWMCDPIGSLLFITGATTLLLSLNWASGKYHWSSAHVSAPFAVGILLLILFGLYQWKGRTDGLLPHVIFRSGPNFPLAAASFAIEGWILYGAMIQMVAQETLNLGFETTAFRNAARNLAYGATALFSSILISWWATRFKDLKRPLYVTWTVFLACCICYATLSPNQNHLQLFYAVLSGIGQAGPLVILVPLIQFATPHAYLSTASGLAYSARSISGAFGSAALAAIYSGYIAQHYSERVGSAAVNAGLPSNSTSLLVKAMLSKGGAAAVKKVPGITPAIIAAATNESRWVYAHAYRLAWWSVVPFVVLAIVCLYFIRNVGDQMTEQVEATVEHAHDKQESKHISA